jgi:hypothetical protein
LFFGCHAGKVAKINPLSQTEWSGTGPLGFQNDDGHGLNRGVSDGKGYIPDPQAVRELGRHTVELEGWTARSQVRYLEVLPANAAPPTSSNRLHPRFLRREAGGITFVPVGLAFYVSNFGGCINAIDESATVTFNCRANAIHLSNIYTGSNDHKLIEFLPKRSYFTYSPAFLFRFTVRRFAIFSPPAFLSGSDSFARTGAQPGGGALSCWRSVRCTTVS